MHSQWLAPIILPLIHPAPFSLPRLTHVLKTSSAPTATDRVTISRRSMRPHRPRENAIRRTVQPRARRVSRTSGATVVTYFLRNRYRQISQFDLRRAHRMQAAPCQARFVSIELLFGASLRTYVALKTAPYTMTSLSRISPLGEVKAASCGSAPTERAAPGNRTLVAYPASN